MVKKRVNGASQKYLNQYFNHYFNNGFNNILNQKYLNLKNLKHYSVPKRLIAKNIINYFIQKWKQEILIYMQKMFYTAK